VVKAPYTKFGETRLIEVKVWNKGKYEPDLHEWDEEIWVERAEDWYALSSQELKNKKVRVVERRDWLLNR
jgi:hypothetical protein